MKKINIAIRGGGVKVPAVGVLKALKEEKVQIRCYSGTSIGAIIATLAALDTSCTEIEQLLKEFVVIYSNASRLKGGKGSQVIEDTVNVPMFPIYGFMRKSACSSGFFHASTYREFKFVFSNCI